MLKFAKECPPDNKLWEVIVNNKGIGVEEGYTLQQVRLSVFLILKTNYSELKDLNNYIRDKKLKTYIAIQDYIPKVPDMIKLNGIDELLYAYALSVDNFNDNIEFIEGIISSQIEFVIVDRNRKNPSKSATSIKLFGLPNDCFPFEPCALKDTKIVTNKEDMKRLMTDMLYKEYDDYNQLIDLSELKVKLPKYLLEGHTEVDEQDLLWENIKVGTMLKYIEGGATNRTMGHYYEVTKIEDNTIYVTDDSGKSYAANIRDRKIQFTIRNEKEEKWHSPIGDIRVGSKVKCIKIVGLRHINTVYTIEGIGVEDSTIVITDDHHIPSRTCTIKTLDKYFTLEEF